MNTLPAIQSGQMGYTFGNLGNCEKKMQFFVRCNQGRTADKLHWTLDFQYPGQVSF